MPKIINFCTMPEPTNLEKIIECLKFKENVINAAIEHFKIKNLFGITIESASRAKIMIGSDTSIVSDYFDFDSNLIEVKTCIGCESNLARIVLELFSDIYGGDGDAYQLNVPISATFSTKKDALIVHWLDRSDRLHSCWDYKDDLLEALGYIRRG